MHVQGFLRDGCDTFGALLLFFYMPINYHAMLLVNVVVLHNLWPLTCDQCIICSY